MGQLENSEAFLRAFETADCETLHGQIRDWFERPYRTPENTIDISAILHSALTSALTAREEECRRHWRQAEADRWKQARQSFDAGMRGFVEALSKQPQPEAYRGEDREQPPRPVSGSMGKGWTIPPANPGKWGSSLNS